MDADRAGDVLDALRPHVLEAEIELVAHLVAHDAADIDPAGVGQRLDARGDVDAVAVDVVAVDDDVADIDADAEFAAPILRHLGVALAHAALDIDGAAHCIDDAGEFDEETVPGRLYDAAAVLDDLGIEQHPPVLLELLEGALLVQPHQPAVADDIRRQDRRKLAFDLALLSIRKRRGGGFVIGHINLVEFDADRMLCSRCLGKSKRQRADVGEPVERHRRLP